jgi:hypothetical protein
MSIMNLVEESGASLASSSQTLFLSPDPASQKASDALKPVLRGPQDNGGTDTTKHNSASQSMTRESTPNERSINERTIKDT